MGIDSLSTRGNLHVIQASVPLAKMFSYIADLRSLSKGRATFAMEFGNYTELPENLAQELMSCLAGALCQTLSFRSLILHECSHAWRAFSCAGSFARGGSAIRQGFSGLLQALTFAHLAFKMS